MTVSFWTQPHPQLSNNLYNFFSPKFTLQFHIDAKNINSSTPSQNPAILTGSVQTLYPLHTHPDGSELTSEGFRGRLEWPVQLVVLRVVGRGLSCSVYRHICIGSQRRRKNPVSHHSTDEPVCGRATLIPVSCLLLMSMEAFWTIELGQNRAGCPQAHDSKHVQGERHNSMLLNTYSAHECCM